MNKQLVDVFVKSLIDYKEWKHEVHSGMDGRYESWYSPDYEVGNAVGRFFINGLTWGVHIEDKENRTYSTHVLKWWHRLNPFNVGMKELKEKIRIMKQYHYTMKKSSHEKTVNTMINEINLMEND